MTLNEVLNNACRSLAPQSATVLVAVDLDPLAKPNTCFGNVIDKIGRNGGGQQLGWVFQHRPDLGLLVALHHAIWVSPGGAFVEITPHEDRECVMLREGKLLFLPDENATLLNDGRMKCGLARPNRAYPLSKNKRIQQMARRFNQSEWDYWAGAKKAVLGK